MTRVCVTGVSGYLGRHLCPELVKRGYDLICVDMVPPEKAYGEFRQTDFSKEDEARRVLDGAEFLIHCASIHPREKYTDEQYLDANVKGTWHVLKAASERGIERVILTSSTFASGEIPPERWPVDEGYIHPSPYDIYSLTKLVQEQIARHFCGQKGMKVIALRPPNFTSKPPLQYEAALLSNCLAVEDVASAHLKALDVWEKLQDNFEPFYITHTFPYSPQETHLLSSNPRSVVDKYFPGAWDWFEQRGVALSSAANRFDSSKAKRILGWQPEYTFGRWWEEHRRGYD